MQNETGWKMRWEQWRPSKGTYFWSCIGCIVATIAVGFTLGGWVTSSTAEEMAKSAAADSRAQLAAAVCVHRFMNGPDAETRLATFKKSDFWSRDDLLEKGGWLAIAGQKAPVDGAAELCAEKLIASEQASNTAS